VVHVVAVRKRRKVSEFSFCFFIKNLKLRIKELFYFFVFISVYPHWPHVFLSLCAAMNTPGPHFGQNWFFLFSSDPFTS